MNRIERVQYEAALALTGTWEGASTDKIYEELGWGSLSDRIMASQACSIL